MSETVTFLLCIEQNAIREQALLLCESIRAFAGPHRHAPIVAVAARAGLGVDAEGRRRLRTLDVEYVEEPLNTVAPLYGSANRVAAAAWIEPRATSDWIVVLDSDTLVLGPLVWPTDCHVALRPVDTKGSASSGPDDPFDEYWQQLAALHGSSPDCLPYIDTVDRTARIRASYNGGLVVVRRETGLLGAWAVLFTRSMEQGLRPWKGSGLNVRASTDMVGVEASEFWGSNQAALALAIWSRPSRLHVLSDAYNVPLHMLLRDPRSPAWPTTRPVVHVHYHWLFAAPTASPAIEALQTLGVTREQLDWLRERTPLLPAGPG